jgi:catechol 2,3-dioxygenase-like lactoylglutathione lyase family enzyme
MNLNQVTLAATNIDESIEFYQRLGLELIVRSPHYARFKCSEGDSTFSIHLADKPQSVSNAVVYFETRLLDQKVSQLQRDGIAFLQEPRDEAWLWREARLIDPSGNTICLYWAGANRLNPPWRIKTPEQPGK